MLGFLDAKLPFHMTVMRAADFISANDRVDQDVPGVVLTDLERMKEMSSTN